VQERLADEGMALVGRDASIREHVDDCPVCGAFVEALGQVDAGLSQLAPISAPATLLARTARAVTGEPESGATSRGADAGAKKLATALAATVILAAGFGLVESVQQELDRSFSEVFTGTRFGSLREYRAPEAPRTPAEPEPVSAQSAPVPMARFEASERAVDSLPMLMSPPAPPAAEEYFAMESPARLRANEGLASAAPQSMEQEKRDRAIVGGEGFTAKASAADDVVAHAAPRASLSGTLDADQVAKLKSIIGEYDRAAVGDRADGKPEAKRPSPPQAVAEMPALEPAPADERDDVAHRRQLSMPGKSGRLAGAKDKQKKNVPVAGGLAPSADPREVARRFLAERERLTGLGFQPASGYWANTYVPGDPSIRLLEARLQRWNRSTLRARIGDPRLEAAAQQNRQPFDVPQNAALATYLHADKRAVEGRSRLRVQIGLQASHKRSGLRPDMNVGVVLDLRRPLDETTGARLRALMMALAKARQPGDRFSITVAGHPGGLLIAPADFRFGPIRVAMQSLFTDSSETPAPSMDLLAALHTAAENVRQGDDASGPLGASLVLLVSTAPLGEQRESLERMAHENAVAGIGLSVVAVGDGADLASIDRLVLLGQGHRRVLAASDDATQLVDRELHAASRAVARAVRLRIRLAPGVELIDVLGSRNLSEAAAQRVREAERSIDQRLARNIGIRADRGEDEEGIQVVIPSFFAGDSHAVLLDVVVPGPGPVADVSVRYKDLVYKRNGVARAQLAIKDGHRGPGPLQRNVLKNQLAHELARSAATAGQQLAAGDYRGAVHTLSSARDLLAGIRLEVSGWDSDDELRGDVALLEQYLKVLSSGYAGAGQHRQHLADSLRYVAFRRLIPPYK
jgi:hypothetical protein